MTNWEIHKTDSGAIHITQGANKTWIATVSEANARLIVQAPEMYRRLTEAAQFLNGEYPNSKENRDYLKISIKSVLAKVEGSE